MTGGWKDAFRQHRALLAVAFVYSVACVAEGLHFKVPASNLLDVLFYCSHAILMPLLFMAGVYSGAFFGYLLSAPGEGVKAAWGRLEETASAYASARLPSILLAVLAMQACNFFLIAKSMIPFANPFPRMYWDLKFAAWDKALHFGQYPHQYIIPFINSLKLGIAVDWAYFLWFGVMAAAACYNLFADTDPHRRMRYLWCYILSWILLGTLAATWFSSVGPVFFSRFYPDEGNPYAAIQANYLMLLKHGSLFMEAGRRTLLFWHFKGKMFDPNAISAMPSMHIAISWLIVLYTRSINRAVFTGAILFCAAIFTGSVYSGFHYAIDGYVSIIGMSVLWWAVGKCLDRRYGRAA